MTMTDILIMIFPFCGLLLLISSLHLSYIKKNSRAYNFLKISTLVFGFIILFAGSLTFLFSVETIKGIPIIVFKVWALAGWCTFPLLVFLRQKNE